MVKRDNHPLWLKITFGLWAVVLFFFFAHKLFPYDMLKARVEDGLARNLGLDVTLGHISPGILWGFTVDGLDIKGVKVTRKLKVSPRWFDLLTGTIGFGFSAEFPSSGQGEGVLRLPPQKSRKPMEMALNLTDVNMSGLSVFFSQRAKPTGNVNCDLSFISPRESYDTATGSLSLTWKKGTLPLNFEGMPIDALTFENLVFDANIDKGVLSIEKADFTGEMSGTMRGNIRLSNDIKRSRMNITGDLILPPSLRSAMGLGTDTTGQGSKFSLRGSMDMPRFRMMILPGSRMSVPARLPQQSPAPQDAVKQQEPVRQMDMKRQQEAVPNQTIEPEDEEHG
jgi:type II secretion system protein N